MRPRAVVTLAAFLATAAYGADPDAFPVENAPDIQEEAPGARVKNREPVSLKNEEQPSDWLATPDEAPPKSEKSIERSEVPAAESAAIPAPAEEAPPPPPVAATEEAPPVAPPPEEPAPVEEEGIEEEASMERGISARRVGTWAKKTGAELQAQVSGLFKSKKKSAGEDEEEPSEEEASEPEEDEPERDVEMSDPDEQPEGGDLARHGHEERPLAIPGHAPPPPEVDRDEDEDEDQPLAIAGGAPERRWRYQQRTIFGMRKRSGVFGVYGAWTGVQTGFGTGPVDTNGLELGAVFGSRLVLGGAVYSTGGFGGGGHEARFSYGGLQTGWIFGSKHLLHPRLDLLIGTGALWDEDTGFHVGTAQVLVPRAGLELNVSRAFHVVGSVGYRYVAAPGLAGKDLSAPEMALTLRFGWL